MKSKNDCDDVLKNNEVLSSKLDFILKDNHSLKNEFDFITKELDLVLKKNESLKIDIDSHVCHARVVPSRSPIACTSSSRINDDICLLKKSVDCLGSTLSHCVVSHKCLKSLFRKKQVPSLHAHPPRHTHAPHDPTHVCSCVHLYTLWT